MKNNITISACLMVKNEEEMLPQCLESIKDIVDEIIVVDTGSEDRTVEIAKSYGAKVYHHPWENNFSKHRNQSISYATGDWMLMIDADEELNTKNLSAAKMREALANVPEKNNAVLATLIDLKRSGRENVRFKFARLFRNTPDFHYEGVVHNKPTYSGSAINSDLQIFHYGYDLDEGKMKAKFKRTTSLLKSRIEKDPNDFEAYFYLANSFGSEGLFEESIEYAKKSIELMPADLNDPRIYFSNYFTISSGYFKQSELDDAKTWALRGLEKNQYDLGLLYILTQICFQTEEFEQVSYYALKYLEAYKIVKEDPVLVGGQFTFHTDESSKKVVEYRLLTVKLILDDMEGFHELWNTVCDKIYTDEKWKHQVLTNIAVAGKGNILLEKTIEVLQENPEDKSLLNPLAEYMAKTNRDKLVHSVAESFKSIDLVNRYLYDFIHQLREHGAAQIALDMLNSIGVPDSPENHQVKELLALYNELNQTKKTTEFVSKLLNKPSLEKSVLEDIIRTVYGLGHPELMEQAVLKLTEQVARLEELDDAGLLALALRIPESGQLESLVEIARILYDRHQVQESLTIDSLDDFAVFFASLGQKYSTHDQMFVAQLAFDLAFTLSHNFEYLDELARLFLDTGNYQGSIRYFNQLLQENFNPKSTLQNMEFAFTQIGDNEAAAKCNNLLQQIG